MSKIIHIYIVLLFLPAIIFGQEVSLSKVEHYKENPDKFFYKVPTNNPGSEYLGEIEVVGISQNTQEVFSKIYKKAKQVGANSFSLKPVPNIDGTIKKFDASHYYLNLYYTESKNIPGQDNTTYIVSSENKSQKISLNNKIVEFKPRTFCKIILQEGEVYSISTRKLLGSRIKVSYSPHQKGQYFQISSFKVGQNPLGTYGIYVKSGDIISLERSYAEFLTLIYEEIN